MTTGESLPGSEKVRKLRTVLHAKAKEEPERRFHALIDKVWRENFLAEAWRRVRRNGGSAGVDAETFADIESYGVRRWLGELARELWDGTYTPKPVRQVLIPKKRPGKFRPLGIPCIRDRVAQTSALLVLEPIFEANLQPEQYAYRPGRSAHGAVKRVHSLLNTGHNEVVDCDLSNYFAEIPHAELLRCFARRISDGRMLRLIMTWLEMPVEDDGRDLGGTFTVCACNLRRAGENLPPAARRTGMGSVVCWRREPAWTLSRPLVVLWKQGWNRCRWKSPPNAGMASWSPGPGGASTAPTQGTSRAPCRRRLAISMAQSYSTAKICLYEQRRTARNAVDRQGPGKAQHGVRAVLADRPRCGSLPHQRIRPDRYDPPVQARGAGRRWRLIGQRRQEVPKAVQQELPLEVSAEQEDQPMRHGRGASRVAGPAVGLLFLLLAAL